jgi:hypothetical protein
MPLPGAVGIQTASGKSVPTSKSAGTIAGIGAFFVGLLCFGMCTGMFTPSRSGMHPTNTPAVVAPANKPYRIARTQLQPVGQFLICVVVPNGSSEQSVRGWHSEVASTYVGRSKRLFINFYEGQDDVDHMIATDEGEGQLLWIKPYQGK